MGKKKKESQHADKWCKHASKVLGVPVKRLLEVYGAKLLAGALPACWADRMETLIRSDVTDINTVISILAKASVSTASIKESAAIIMRRVTDMCDDMYDDNTGTEYTPGDPLHELVPVSLLGSSLLCARGSTVEEAVIRTQSFKRFDDFHDDDFDKITVLMDGNEVHGDSPIQDACTIEVMPKPEQKPEAPDANAVFTCTVSMVPPSTQRVKYKAGCTVLDVLTRISKRPDAPTMYRHWAKKKFVEVAVMLNRGESVPLDSELPTDAPSCTIFVCTDLRKLS